MAEKKKFGGKQAGAGRKKGVPNKNTQAIRDAYQKLIEDNLPNYKKWLSEIAADDPVKAINLLTGMAEFVLPKLQRSEHTGADGSPLDVVINTPTKKDD